MSYLIVALVIVLLGLIFFVKPREKTADVTCPKCQSSNLWHKLEQVDERVFEYPSAGGGHTHAMQVDYKIHYRCHNCKTKWVDKITKTN